MFDLIQSLMKLSFCLLRKENNTEIKFDTVKNYVTIKDS